MIRPTGIGASTPATPARRAKGGAGAFQIDSTPSAASSTPAPASSATDILRALIALQGVAAGEADRRRKIAAAQWTLSLLDRVRVGLLEGASSTAEIEALAEATAAVIAPDTDEALQGVLADVALLARVELAKRGR